MTNLQYQQIQQLFKLANNEINSCIDKDDIFNLSDALYLNFATHNRLDASLFKQDHINDKLLAAIDKLNIILEQLEQYASYDNSCSKLITKLKIKVLFNLGTKAINRYRQNCMFALIMSSNSIYIDTFHATLNKLIIDFKNQHIDTQTYKTTLKFVKIDNIIEYLNFLISKIKLVENITDTESKT